MSDMMNIVAMSRQALLKQYGLCITKEQDARFLRHPEIGRDYDCYVKRAPAEWNPNRLCFRLHEQRGSQRCIIPGSRSEKLKYLRNVFERMQNVLERRVSVKDPATGGERKVRLCESLMQDKHENRMCNVFLNMIEKKRASLKGRGESDKILSYLLAAVFGLAILSVIVLAVVMRKSKHAPGNGDGPSAPSSPGGPGEADGGAAPPDEGDKGHARVMLDPVERAASVPASVVQRPPAPQQGWRTGARNWARRFAPAFRTAVRFGR